MRGIFIGRRRQRGHGVGGFFRSILRTATPLLKEGAKYIARKSMRTGVGVVEDILEGQDPRSALRKRMLRMRDDVKRDGIRKIRRMTGRGRISRKKKKKEKKKKNRKRKSKVKCTSRHDVIDKFFTI